MRGTGSRTKGSTADERTRVTDAAGDQRMRLLRFEGVELQLRQTRDVTMTADPLLLAGYDGEAGQRRIIEGIHPIALAKAADDLVLSAETRLAARSFGR
jgi:beta-glucosidase